MGFLVNNGAELGAAFAGQNPTAQTLAQRSLAFGSLSTGLDTGAAFASGLAQAQQARYAAGAARANATGVQLAGQANESALKMKYTALGASQEAAQAANGVDVGSGSALRVREATANLGALDAAMIHFNAAREAFGLRQEAALYDTAAKNAVIGGALRSGATFLSGAQSLADKWLMYKQSGAFANG